MVVNGSWTTECTKVPAGLDHILVDVGVARKLFFKPLKGINTYCGQLQLSEDGETWTTGFYAQDILLDGGISDFEANPHFDADKNAGVELHADVGVGFWWGLHQPNIPSGTKDEDGNEIMAWRCDEDTDYIHLTPPQGAVSMEITYSGWYNQPGNSDGQMTIETGDDSTTLLKFIDGHREPNDGQTLQINNVYVYRSKMQNEIDRTDTLLLTDTIVQSGIKIGMCGFMHSDSTIGDDGKVPYGKRYRESVMIKSNH